LVLFEWLALEHTTQIRRSQVNDKKQETEQAEKSQSTKPAPYPLRSVDNADNTKDIITVEHSIEAEE
jgi:hypothetical protein